MKDGKKLINKIPLSFYIIIVYKFYVGFHQQNIKNKIHILTIGEKRKTVIFKSHAALHFPIEDYHWFNFGKSTGQS